MQNDKTETPAAFLLRRLAEEGRDDLIREYHEQNRTYQRYLAEKHRARRAELNAWKKQKEEVEKDPVCEYCFLPLSECPCQAALNN